MPPKPKLPGLAEAPAAMFVPHKPARPEKSEGGKRFKVVSDMTPKGDQPTAIKELVAGLKANERDQVLLGVTGFAAAMLSAGATQTFITPFTGAPKAIFEPSGLMSGWFFSGLPKMILRGITSSAATAVNDPLRPSASDVAMVRALKRFMWISVLGGRPTGPANWPGDYSNVSERGDTRGGIRGG